MDFNVTSISETDRSLRDRGITDNAGRERRALARGLARSAVVRAGDYLTLMKPRVMSLVVFTAVVGLLSAPSPIHPANAIIAVLCIAVGAGAAGVLNMWYDADIDAVMARTANRPIPTGRVCRGEALRFGLLLAPLSVFLLGLLINVPAAALLAATIGFYVLIYTMWLKRRSSYNIVIGGAAGALPPAIGWVAATGTLSIEPLLLVLVIFLWTPAHFWALSLLRAHDYARAGIPMLPVIAGEAKTRQQILVYALLTAIASLLPWVLGFVGPVYGAIAIAVSTAMVLFAWRLWTGRGSETQAARRLFAFSIIYLFSLFAAYMAEKELAVLLTHW
jgi:heme o synthase